MPNLHHTLDELESFYKSAQRSIERTRWHIIWLKAKGRKTSDIADVVGYHPNTVRRIISSYSLEGADGILDGRQFNSSEPALNEAQQKQLFEAINKEREDKGLWTSEKVRLYVKENFGIEITTPCAWGYFERLGFSFQAPRPKHINSATEEEQTNFKKWR